MLKYLYGSIIGLLVLSFMLASCSSNTKEEKLYIESVEKERKAKDEDFKNDPRSPFNNDDRAEFKPLNYYKPDPEYVFKSKFYRYENPDTVTIFGTKGEERSSVREGYVKINFEGKEVKVNVYKGSTKTGEEYHSIWFTDKTTGEETYGVGRYLDFELSPDENYIYTIDFNKAYNPYCAYSAKYSCAIPTKEDHIDIAIEAGEKNFH